MTVSRALSNNPKVKDETRTLVLKRAQELGYVKSVAAKAMRGEKTTVVGLLLPNLVNEFYARFADNLAAALERNGLQVVIHLTNDDIEMERQSLLRLHEIQAQAVVMVPAPGMLEEEAFYLKDMRVIQLIRQRTLKTASSAILIHDAAAIMEAVEVLAGQGHKRIGYLGAQQYLSSGNERLHAFRAGMQAVGLSSIKSVL
ncbi:MAG: hypothetical protein KVP17_005226, partial [Porospora cf. gigantea B]|uniref:uncharacterized protein n=1 Tax=Porospora cf. gigantea B TaxID=2853592 RepID=UPI003571E12E